MATNDFIVKNGLQVNENAAILETTDATSATDTSAALRTAGGAAVAKKLYVGTNLDVQGTSNLVGNVTVTGDVAVNGGDLTTTSTSVTLFNTNATTVDAFEAATTINIGSAGGTTTVQNALTVNGAFTASPINANVAISPTGTGTVTISPAGALTINPTAASTINNTSIGASTRSTGAFTTLAANNAVTFTAGTASSSTATGTLVVTGGVGVSGQVTATTFSGNYTGGSGSFTTLAASGAVTFTQNTGSTSTTTGTLVVTGGVGISERLYAGSIQNTPIGSSVANTAAFTTLTSNGATTFTAGTASTTTGTGTVVVTGGIGLSGAVNAGASSSFAGLTSTSTTTLSPANASVTISPTGTGTVTIAPATAGTINNMSIGATTRASGAFTTLAANSTVTLTAGANNSSLTTTGAGVLTISSGTTGSIDNMTIGATTATTGRFTTVTSTVATGTAPFTVASTTVVTNLNADYLDGIDSSRVIYGTNGSGSNTASVAQTLTEVAQYKSGFWEANGTTWAPDTGWWWGATFAHTSNTSSYNYNGQLAFKNGGGGDNIWARTVSGGATPTASSWSKLLSSGNYNDYAPTKTGTGATGTWGISISGNAATANSATSATNSTYLSTYDDRIKAPSDDDAGKVRFGFTSWGNNNTSPYADYFHLRSYTDSSGGSDNLVMFRKDAIGMRIWQQSWGSASVYSNYKDVAFVDNTTYVGTTAIALNRSSASQSLTGVNIDGSSGSCTGNAATVTNGVYTTGDQTIGGNKTFSGSTTNPKLFINRSGNTASGISYYSSGYTAWCEYMAQQGQTSVGPTGNITAPTGVFVTSWAIRNFVEDAAGYGWTFEGGSSTGQPATKVEIRSSDGTIYTRGGIYAAGDIYSSYSDLNLKTVVAPVENAIDKVMKIDTIYYKPNETAKELGIDTTEDLRIGVTAQSVEEAEPLLVKPIAGHDKYNTVDYQRLTVLLIAAMKEQQKEIDMLKSKLGL